MTNRYNYSRWVTVLAALLCGNFAIAQDRPSSFFLGSANPSTIDSVGANSWQGRSMAIDYNLFPVDRHETSLNEQDSAPAPSLTLEVFDGETLTLLPRQIVRRDDRFDWYGSVEGHRISHVTLVFEKSVVYGLINYSGKQVRVGFKGEEIQDNSQIYITEEFLDRYPPYGEDAGKRQALPSPESGAELENNASIWSRAPIWPNSNPDIDILAVFTQAARDWATDNFAGGMQALVNASEAQTNNIFAASDIDLTVDIVATMVTGWEEDIDDMISDIDEIVDPADGVFDAIHNWRNDEAADVVIVYTVGEDFCGYAANIPSPAGYAQSVNAFAITAAGCAVGNMTFIHELGHLLSARHDRANDNTPSAPYDFNHGFADDVNGFRSVMALGCIVNNQDQCPRVARISDGERLFQGAPVGVPVGDPDAADNQYTIELNKHILAGYRAQKSGTPSGVAGSPGNMAHIAYTMFH